MLLAYLRGLLRPRYDQGVRSVLRENMLLEALSMELDAQAISLSTQVHATYAPLMQPKAAVELMGKQQTTLQNLRYLVEFDDKVAKMKQATPEGEHADIFALYKALEDAGLVGENAIEIPEPASA